MSLPPNNTRDASPLSLPRIDNIEQPFTHLALFAYAVFLAGFFLTTSAVNQYKFLLAIVFLPGLVLVPRLWRMTIGDAVLRLAALYLLYLLLTALWAPAPHYATLAGDAVVAGLILFFMALTAYLKSAEPRWFDLVVFGVVVVAAANALFSIVVWDGLDNIKTSRLVGLGTLREPNSAGAVYGLYALLGIAWAGRMRSKLLANVLLVSGFALLAFMLLTQSRAAIIACAVGLLLMTVLNRRGRPIVPLVALLLAIGLSVSVATNLDRSSFLRLFTWDIRLELWADSFRHIARTPLFGNGYLSGLTVHSDNAGEDFTNWHNSYLAALRDGGIVGLALLLWFLGSAVQRAWQIGRDSGDYALLALLCFGLIYMLGSTDALITRPRELWAILWFPVGLLAGCRQRMRCGDMATQESR